MDNIFITSGIISFVFLIAKFMEMRFIEKETKPLKFLIRDALLVYFSVIASYFIISQIKTNINGGSSSLNITPVFTDNPGF